MKTVQVFVSHTSDMAQFPEGRSFVQAALDAVNRAGMAPVDMRYFAARDGQPADYCRRRVRDSEVYIAVVGRRYGMKVPGQAVSYTELEFDEASSGGLPRLVFLLDDAAGPPGAPADADRSEVDEFRQRLREAGLIVATFSSATGLELEVFHALAEVAGDVFRGGAATAQSALEMRYSLPADTVMFAGRSEEIDRIVAAVTEAAAGASAAAVHTISGMPGVGKTAFAVHAAHRVADRFPDGQLFISLHAHTPGVNPLRSGEALSILLQLTGMTPRQIPASLQARQALWRGRLVGKKVLLVLDDATGSDQVQPLLPATPDTLVLVTSRRRLPALANAAPVSLDCLSPEDGAELFVGTARRPGLNAGDDLVQQVVSQCGALPLAITLVASRLRHHVTWTVADISQDLAAATDRLAELRAEDVSVTAAFDLSYRDLSLDHQRLFRRLGASPAIDIDSYCAARLDGIPLATVSEALRELEDQHLIDEPVRGRYRMHDLTRHYARALAAENAADTDLAVRRVLDYYIYAAAVASRHVARRTPARQPALATPPATANLGTPRQALIWMQEEWPNLRAITEYARAHGLSDVVLSLASALHGFLRVEGHWLADLDLQHGAVAAAREEADQPGRAAALVDMADAQYMLDRYPAALTSLAQAIGLYRELGDRRGRADALTVRGDVQRQTGAHEAAKQDLDEAISLYQSVDDQVGLANALLCRGDICLQDGALPAAGHALRQALQGFRDLDQPVGLAHALMFLGDVQRQSAAYADAAQTLAQALALFTEHDDRSGQANTRVYLGIAQYTSGEYELAAENLQQALALQTTLGDRLGLAGALTILGDMLIQTGNLDAATENLEQALDLFRDLGHLPGEANTLNYLGNARRVAGDLVHAEEHLQAALALFTGLNMPGGVAEARNHLGELMSAAGRSAEANNQHSQALKIARRIGSPLDEARALEGIASYCRTQRQLGEAAKHLRQALEIYDRIGAPAADRVRRQLEHS
jgi:tetratricopeptide (TPR) repeat protein